MSNVSTASHYCILNLSFFSKPSPKVSRSNRRTTMFSPSLKNDANKGHKIQDDMQLPLVQKALTVQTIQNSPKLTYFILLIIHNYTQLHWKTLVTLMILEALQWSASPRPRLWFRPWDPPATPAATMQAHDQFIWNKCFWIQPGKSRHHGLEHIGIEQIITSLFWIWLNMNELCLYRAENVPGGCMNFLSDK